MPASTITYSTTLHALDCGECSIPFGVPVDFHRRVKRTGADFWCPNGHKIAYSETDYDRMKAKAEREERWRREAETRTEAARDQARAAERSASAYKGRVTRLKNRAAAGVCPCCQRTFQQLARHMSAKHPDFADSAE